MSNFFCMKVIQAAFFELKVWLYTFWRKKMGRKASLFKMLVKFNIGQKDEANSCACTTMAKKICIGGYLCHIVISK